LCRGLENLFSSHVQANLYLTPPSAQGFRTHYDNHDVLVIQVEGEKAWRLYDMPIEAPFRGEGFEPGKYETGALREEFVLKAGDCAYVPRGLMHDALTAGDAASLHVTVGLITRTWADLMLEAVSEVALRTPELRRSLPAGYAQRSFDRTAANTELQKLGALLARELKLDPALDLMVDTFIRSRPAENRNAVNQAGKPLAANDRFVLKRHAPFRIAEDGDGIVLIAPGGDLDFVADDRPALESALNGQPFAFDEIKAAKPDAIVSTLLAYGLIVRA
jgi:ribosomal protein L16 Arg81 hydroxylase